MLVGDVHPVSVESVASYLTPVPGGVGPLTIIMLMKNTVKAARPRRRREAREPEEKLNRRQWQQAKGTYADELIVVGSSAHRSLHPTAPGA